MMKPWRRFCFLVLVVSSTSRGQPVTPQLDEDLGDTILKLPPLGGRASTKNETEPSQLPSTAPLHTNSSTSKPDSNFTESESKEIVNGFNGTNTTTEVSSSTVAHLTTLATEAAPTTKPDIVTTVSMTTGSPTSAQAAGSSASSWGYVILVLIILVIVVLCVILYFLRRVSRTYSFDLQRPSPICRNNEPIGTFEPVYLDDIDRPVVPIDDLSLPPVANGTSLPTEDKGATGETAPQEHSDVNGIEMSPVSNASPPSAEDSADKAPSQSDSTDLFLDVLGEEQQNENNNNPSVCAAEPFVEINLDEPALCDLLTSPDAASSVLPFSFSSSSS